MPFDEDLEPFVVAELQARKGQWREIAKAVPEVSYSWISQIARGKYKSDPGHRSLKAVGDWLKDNPMERERQVA